MGKQAKKPANKMRQEQPKGKRPTRQQGDILSVENIAALEAAREAATKQWAGTPVAAPEPVKAKEPVLTVEESTNSDLLDSLWDSINIAIAPMIEEGEEVLAEADMLRQRHDNATVGVTIVRRAIKRLEGTEGSRLAVLIAEKDTLKRELEQKRNVDGIVVSKYPPKSEVMMKLEDVDRAIRKVHNQVGIVVAEHLGLKVDEMYDIYKTDQGSVPARAERKQ